MATGGEARLSSSASDVCDMGFPPGPRLYAGGKTTELAAGVERALAALQPKEAQVTRRRFGVSVETPQTLNESAAVLGLTRERIGQLEAAGLRRRAGGRP